MTKQELREIIKQRSPGTPGAILGSRQQNQPILEVPVLADLQSDYYLSESSRINAELKQATSGYSVVLAYYPLKDEPDIKPLLHSLIDEHKTVLLPAVVSPTEMVLREYTGECDLQRGALGTKEPTGKIFTDYDKIDLALIPGVAFTPQGDRLGRGKGYYDRLLPLLKKAYKIGVCFPYQIVEHIPCEPHDITVDYVQS